MPLFFSLTNWIPIKLFIYYPIIILLYCHRTATPCYLLDWVQFSHSFYDLFAWNLWLWAMMQASDIWKLGAFVSDVIAWLIKVRIVFLLTECHVLNSGINYSNYEMAKNVLFQFIEKQNGLSVLQRGKELGINFATWS